MRNALKARDLALPGRVERPGAAGREVVSGGQLHAWTNTTSLGLGLSVTVPVQLM